MFKTVESKWNAHTPTYLHPRTKENLIWQLKLAGVLLVWIVAKDLWEERQLRRRYKDLDSEEN